MDSEETYKKAILNFGKDNASVPQLKFIVDDPDHVRITPVTDAGMVNFIFRVQSADHSQSVILKYGEDKIRVKLGDGGDVPMERQTVEYEALKIFDSIQPGSVPRPYCFDPKHQIIAMEDLSDMHLLHDDLSKGKVDVELARKLGALFAKFHRSTNKTIVSSEQWNKLTAIFSPREGNTISPSMRLTTFFLEDSPFLKILPECLETFRRCKAELDVHQTVQKLLALYEKDVCLCHIDPHSKAIFVSDSRFSTFDCEWSTIAHPAGDIGFLLPWYSFALLELKDRPDFNVEEIKRTIKLAVESLVDAYIQGSGDLYNDVEARGTIISQICGFTAAFIFGHTNFCNMQDFVDLTPAKQIEAMELSTKLMVHFCTHPTTDMNNFIQLLFP